MSTVNILCGHHHYPELPLLSWASQVATRMLFHPWQHCGAGGYLRLCAPPPSAWGSFKDVLLGSSLETCLAGPSLLPSASSVQQWSSWRCVWGHCHTGTLPCDPVSGGRGSCSAAVFHSTCLSSCFPQWNVTLQHLQHLCSPRPWHSHHHAWL